LYIRKYKLSKSDAETGADRPVISKEGRSVPGGAAAKMAAAPDTEKDPL
jgi:hypothetical protein